MIKLVKYIVITRPEKEGKEIKKLLEREGYKILLYPTIKISKNDSLEIRKALSELNTFNIIVFTSKNGVELFMKVLKNLNIDNSILNSKYIAAVGPVTANAVKTLGFEVNFVPSVFTTEKLGQEIPKVFHKKILLARSAIATPLLKLQLEKRGAKITDIPIYNTSFIEKPGSKLESLLKQGAIAAITFTSPSTVEGFTKTFIQYNKYLTIPVFAIGPVTAKAAKEKGFKKIFTSEKFTAEGLIKKLKDKLS